MIRELYACVVLWWILSSLYFSSYTIIVWLERYIVIYNDLKSMEVRIKPSRQSRVGINKAVAHIYGRSYCNAFWRQVQAVFVHNALYLAYFTAFKTYYYEYYLKYIKTIQQLLILVYILFIKDKIMQKSVREVAMLVERQSSWTRDCQVSWRALRVSCCERHDFI